jgi:hypothetical protein
MARSRVWRPQAPRKKTPRDWLPWLLLAPIIIVFTVLLFQAI